MAAEYPGLSSLSLTSDEKAVFERLRQKIVSDRFALELRNAYFDARQLIKDLGISIPPQLKGLHTVIGWPRIGVEAIEHRLDLEAFRWADGGDSSELEEIAEANNVFDEAPMAHLDALIYGREFITVGSKEPEDTWNSELPLMTIEAATNMAVDWDPRARRTRAAVREWCLDGQNGWALLLPNATIHVQESRDGGLSVVDRDDHRMGVVPVARMANRQRTNQRQGNSEITWDVMSVTDAACRRLMGIEVGAEFFQAPQRYILGVSEESFQTADGAAVSAWETYIGRVLGLERDEDGNLPEVGQFAAHDPSGQTRIIDLYARIMASQLGLPPHMLGYTSDNPASADAIRSAESALVKKAERRIRRFSAAWRDAMRLALWFRAGERPDPGRRIETVWRNPATPTVAAATDAVVKLVQAGVLPADSEVALERAGFSADERRRVAAERRRSRATGLLEQLGTLPDAPPPGDPDDVAV